MPPALFVPVLISTQLQCEEAKGFVNGRKLWMPKGKHSTNQKKGSVSISISIQARPPAMAREALPSFHNILLYSHQLY